METTGRLTSVTKDILSGKLNVTFQIDTEPVEELNVLGRMEQIDILAEKHKKKRSNDANGLLWYCLGEIAKSMSPPADKWDVYLDMLKHYGQYTYICVKPNVVDAMKAQWRECEVVGEIDINGQQAVQMLCYFGSSTYDSKQFSVLLEGVIGEMKNLGLTPPTPKELRRVIEQWEKQKSGKM